MSLRALVPDDDDDDDDDDVASPFPSPLLLRLTVKNLICFFVLEEEEEEVDDVEDSVEEPLVESTAARAALFVNLDAIRSHATSVERHTLHQGAENRMMHNGLLVFVVVVGLLSTFSLLLLLRWM
jgi:hypothetical protein